MDKGKKKKKKTKQFTISLPAGGRDLVSFIPWSASWKPDATLIHGMEI
jgi:hypothetical protein